MTKVKGILLMIAAVLLLSACSANVEEEQKATYDKVVAAYNEAPNKANKNNDDIEFYLPFGYEIKETTPNNVMIKNGAKTYILSYNQHEGLDSQVVYQATIDAKEKVEYNKTFAEEDEFAYLLIQTVDEKLHEVTVGIGGIKMTTKTKVSSMKNDAEVMMQMVKSVKFLNEEEDQKEKE